MLSLEFPVWWEENKVVQKFDLDVIQTGGRYSDPYNGRYGEAPPERGTFFRLQVHERVGISLVEVYKRVGKSVIWVCKRAQKCKWVWWLWNIEKTFNFCDWFLFKRQCIFSSKREAKFYTGMWIRKGYHMSIEGWYTCTKGILFSLKMVYKRVRGWTSRRSLTVQNICWVPPSGGGGSEGSAFRVW